MSTKGKAAGRAARRQAAAGREERLACWAEDRVECRLEESRHARPVAVEPPEAPGDGLVGHPQDVRDAVERCPPVELERLQQLQVE